ncbi:hypothetical protein [Streptomyces sp. SID8352]|uniref:hypothetical protein n=1 Tax=Streptomyces sp. SID8352 TaxID=2690338 RepID=UPI00136AF055|nr:hypothetical protein [Streptomyces sp. SID8352]MYU25210.1 hypothetical protein [Streptomyces sp. SID8352]
MRRTARALSAALLTGAALGMCAGTATAESGTPPQPPGVGETASDTGPDTVPETVPDGAGYVPDLGPGAEEPGPLGLGRSAAEVDPAAVGPGGTVTVAVSCGETGGPAPATLDATSAAFDEGTVVLRRVADAGGGPAYRGTARVAPADSFPDTPDAAGADHPWTVDGTCPGEAGSEGDPWSADMTVSPDGAAGPPCPESATPGAPCAGNAPAQPSRPERPDQSARPDPSARPGQSPCPGPAAPHGEGAGHGTSCTTRPPCPEPVAPDGACGTGTPEHGVRAGSGGAFTDSVPALAAGGALIAGAFGAAAHRLLRRGSGVRR